MTTTGAEASGWVVTTPPSRAMASADTTASRSPAGPGARSTTHGTADPDAEVAQHPTESGHLLQQARVGPHALARDDDRLLPPPRDDRRIQQGVADVGRHLAEVRGWLGARIHWLAGGTAESARWFAQ